ncbi:MAG: single-stranded DNA-binding protein [Hymenobacteraceae bacterium]|nr:single-stranded DNA-binding protein [Hymenobacteraceae bacterium]
MQQQLRADDFQIPPHCQAVSVSHHKVAKFSLATTETYRDKNGQPQSQTDWHSIVLWRGLAELAQNYLHKGSLIFLEGKLKYRHYDDEQGRRHYVTEIIGDHLLLLDRKAAE